MVLRLTWLLLSSWMLLPLATGARPWEPNVTIPSTEGVSNPRPPPDPEVQKRFNAALARGRDLLAKGKYQEARVALGEAVELMPDHVGARLQRARATLILGYLNWNRGLIEEAAADTARALAIEPDNQEVKSLDELLRGLQKRMLAPTKSK